MKEPTVTSQEIETNNELHQKIEKDIMKNPLPILGSNIVKKRPVINRGKASIVPSSIFGGQVTTQISTENSNNPINPEAKIPDSSTKSVNSEENRRDSDNFETIQIEQEKPQEKDKGNFEIHYFIEKPQPAAGLFNSIASYLMNKDEEEPEKKKEVINTEIENSSPQLFEGIFFL